jgi:hypothetical protein
MTSVPFKTSKISNTSISSSNAVRGATWYDAAHSLNWSLGQGDVIVPRYAPMNVVAVGASCVYNFRVTPNGRATVRRWTVYQEDTAGNIQSSYDYVEPIATKVLTVSNISYTYTNASSAPQKIVGLTCREEPRKRLDNDTDKGIEEVTVMARAPIDCNDYSSIGGVFEAAVQPFRRHYFANSLLADKTGGSKSTTTTTLAYIVQNGIFCPRKIYVADSTAPITWHFLVSAENASYGGTIRITNVKNASYHDIVIPGSAPLAAGFIWIDYDSIDFECEDMSLSNGMVSNTPVQYHIAFKAESATAGRTFYLAAWCAEETVVP